MISLILTHSLFHDQEVIYPYYRLREEGSVVLVAEIRGKIKGLYGVEIESDGAISGVNYDLDTFDLLALPGGVRAMEKLRMNAAALSLVHSWAFQQKPIAVICSGVQMLLSARIPLAGRRIAAYPALRVDVENAGAKFVEEPVVVDANIISSPHYRHLAEWMSEAIKQVKARQ